MTLDVHDGPDGVRVLRGAGELDATSLPELLPAVAGLVEGARSVVLDLTGVTFFDSGGVRLVDRLARTCARRHVPFAVTAPPGCRARRVLDLVGMSSLVTDPEERS